MTLGEYIKQSETNNSEFARKLGVSRHSVIKWTQGDFPNGQMIARIALATGGAVQPNDWFQDVDGVVKVEFRGQIS